MNKRLLKILESMALKKETQTSNEMIVLKNTVGGTSLAISLHGDIYQEKREGYNLADTSKIKNRTIYGINVTNNEDGSITLKGTATAEMFIPIVESIITTSENEGTYSVVVYGIPDNNDNGFVNISYMGNPKSGQVLKTNIPAERNLSMLFKGPAGTVVDCTLKPVILKGNYTVDTLPTYEKFGQAPSDEFPSPIQSVKDICNVKVQNKNYFTKKYIPSKYVVDDNNDFYFKNRNISQTILFDRVKLNLEYGTYTISGKYSNSLNLDNVNMCLLRIYNTDGTIKETGETVEFNSNDEEIALLIYSNQNNTEAVGQTADLYFKDVMIERNDKATSFIRQHEQNFNLDIPEEYALYKDGYFVKIGNNWFLKQFWGEKIFDGTVNKIVTKHESIFTETQGFYVFGLPNKFENGLNGSIEYAYCNYLKFINQSVASIAINETGLWWQKSKSTTYASLPFTSVDDVNNWLKVKYESGIPLKIVYKLNEPTLTQITDENFIDQLEALAKAVACDDTTIVDCEAEGLKPYIEVKFDTDRISKIETELEKIELANLSQGGNV